MNILKISILLIILSLHLFSFPLHATPSLAVKEEIGLAPFEVSLNAPPTKAEKGPYKFYYDFGDGSKIIERTSAYSIPHTYKAGIYNASVRAVDSNGLEIIAKVKITSLTEGPPEISIHTKNTYDLYLNHLQGEEIVLIASNSISGDGGVVQYEWLSGEKVIGRESEIIIPSERIGKFNYSLRLTNRKKRSTTKDFTVTISPNVYPEINIDQANLFVPSKVILSITNSQKLIGIKSVKWSNQHTSDHSTGETFTQIIQHEGQTPIVLEVEDTFGRQFAVRVLITAYSEGPYLEGPSEIEIVPGDTTYTDFEPRGSSDTRVTLKEQIPGIKVTEHGSLSINIAKVPTNGKFITLVASNEFSSFEKKIKLVGLIPVPLATIPAGFVGTFIINAPHSLLHKTQIKVTKESTRGTTTIHFFESKSKDGNLLITKTEGGELIHPLQITFPPSVMGTHRE